MYFVKVSGCSAITDLKGGKPARQKGRQLLRPLCPKILGVSDPVVPICLHYRVNGWYSMEPSFDFSQEL